MEVEARTLLREAHSNPSKLIAIIQDDHADWKDVLQDAKYEAELDTDSYANMERIQEFSEAFGRSIVTSAAARLIALRHRRTILDEIVRRIREILHYLAEMKKTSKPKPSIESVIKRDCKVVLWLLMLKPKELKSLGLDAIELAHALTKTQIDPENNHAINELHAAATLIAECLPPARNTGTIVPGLQVDHSIPDVFGEIDRGGFWLTSIQTGQPVRFVNLDRRLARFLAAAWFITWRTYCGVEQLVPSAVYRNEMMTLRFDVRSLQTTLKKTASRTNLHNLRHTIHFDGDVPLIGNADDAFSNIYFSVFQKGKPPESDLTTDAILEFLKRVGL